MATPVEVHVAAVAWYGAGFCVIPPKPNGTKVPLVPWTHFQTTRPDPGLMSDWYEGGTQYGVGLLCGQVSGNLEMLELEGRVANDSGFMQDIQYNLRDAGLLELWERLEDGYSEWTPSGGLHFLYRISDHEVPGNTKIATRPKDPKHYTDRDRETLAKAPKAVIMETLIETRGEGGYVVVAPSQGPVHPSGNPWTRGAQAEYGQVPTIAWAEREALFACLAAFDVPRPQPEAAPLPAPQPSTQESGDRVGDDFNARGDWGFLVDHGWTVSPRRGDNGETLWVRPGKNWTEGHSASTGYSASGDRFYVWSSATEFPTETPLSRFHVYATLEHRGDYRAAARALGAKGFGKPLAPRVPQQRFGDFVPSVTSAPVAQPTDEDDIYNLTARSFGEVVATVPVRPVLPASGRESFTDTGTANRFMREHRDRYLYVRDQEEWLYYDGSIWRRDATGRMVGDAVEAMIDRMDDEAKSMRGNEDQIAMGKELAKYVRGARMNAGRKGLLATIAAKMSITSADLDRHRHLVGLLNGTLDVTTGTVIAPNPAHLVTRYMDVTYDPNAQAPQTREYFETVLPNAERRDFVQRAIGYTMTGEQDQRAFFVVHGRRGTGKSQFVELLGKMFGTYATVAADGAFRKRERGASGPAAELHALQGARYVFASESDEDVVFDADIVKRICGGDTMSTRTLYEKRMQMWRPECVVWLATNNFPRFPVDEEAVWDRVKPIEFETVFERDGSGEHERVQSISELLYAEEASGILNLMIEWLLRYREVGLKEPEIIGENIEARKVEGDPVAQFWDEMTASGEMVPDEDALTLFPQLYTHYVNWCKETLGLTVTRGSNRFGRGLKVILKHDGLYKTNGKSYLKGWRKMGYSGLLGSIQ